jgi:hypothetical protein
VDRAKTIRELFGAPRALIGVVHVGALPGTPAARETVDALAERAVTEARLYERAGLHGIALENMHDRPYLKRRAPPEVVAGMTAVGREVRRAVRLPFGVQILAGANREALAVAHACGASFVRVEGFVFAHVADEGLMTSDAGALLRYRRAIGAEGIRVFADVKKKHSAHAITADVSLGETAETVEFMGADCVIVTGSATGQPPSRADVQDAKSHCGLPVFLGSGISADNISQFHKDADGFIVGSFFKVDGLWSNTLDPARVERFMKAVDLAQVKSELARGPYD